MKLFCIRDLSNGRIIPDLFFATKAEAKLERDKRGASTHCVSYGPDHRHYRG